MNDSGILLSPYKQILFQCLVIKRANVFNCPWILNKPRISSINNGKEQQRQSQQEPTQPHQQQRFDFAALQPLSERYTISLTRRQVSCAMLRKKLEEACGVSADTLKLCCAEEITTNDNKNNNNSASSRKSPVSSQTILVPISDEDELIAKMKQMDLLSSSDILSSPGMNRARASSEAAVRSSPGQLLVTPISDEAPSRNRCYSAESAVPSTTQRQQPSTMKIVAFEDTLCERPGLGESEEGDDDYDDLDDCWFYKGGRIHLDREEMRRRGIQDDKGLLDCSREVLEQRHVTKTLRVYGDEKECRMFDTDPTALSKAMSRSLWPESESDLKKRVGLRVDAKDRCGTWFPGSVIEVIETGSLPTSPYKKRNNNTPTNRYHRFLSSTKIKARVRFDNCSSKVDGYYTIDQFHQGDICPIYTHTRLTKTLEGSRTKQPIELMIQHKYKDKSESKSSSISGGSISSSSSKSKYFGRPFSIQCHHEWSTARAGAHIIAQATRYLQRNPDHNPADNKEKVQQLYKKVHLHTSYLIDLLVEFDREYVRRALGDPRSRKEQKKRERRGVDGHKRCGGGGNCRTPNPSFSPSLSSFAPISPTASLSSASSSGSSGRGSSCVLSSEDNNDGNHKNKPTYRNPSFDATELSSLMEKKLEKLLRLLPFEIRVCTIKDNVQVPFQFSLDRTIGNYINTRVLTITLQWREPPTCDKATGTIYMVDTPVLYLDPHVFVEPTPNMTADDTLWDNVCPICCEENMEMIQIPHERWDYTCGDITDHRMCIQCATQYNKDECPFCRGVIRFF